MIYKCEDCNTTVNDSQTFCHACGSKFVNDATAIKIKPDDITSKVALWAKAAKKFWMKFDNITEDNFTVWSRDPKNNNDEDLNIDKFEEFTKTPAGQEMLQYLDPRCYDRENLNNSLWDWDRSEFEWTFNFHWSDFIPTFDSVNDAKGSDFIDFSKFKMGSFGWMHDLATSFYIVFDRKTVEIHFYNEGKAEGADVVIKLKDGKVSAENLKSLVKEKDDALWIQDILDWSVQDLSNQKKWFDWINEYFKDFTLDDLKNEDWPYEGTDIEQGDYKTYIKETPEGLLKFLSKESWMNI